MHEQSDSARALAGAASQNSLPSDLTLGPRGRGALPAAPRRGEVFLPARREVIP